MLWSVSRAVAYFFQSGATGDGSALIASGGQQFVYEIDALVTTRGFYVNVIGTIFPRRLFQVGWIALSTPGSFPPTFSVPVAQMTAYMFVDAESRVFSTPTFDPSSSFWNADTIIWSFGDSVVDLAVYY
jgi:hypothetical protein